MIILLLTTFAVAQGAYFALYKLVQKDYIRSINQSIFFIAINSFFQFLFLFALPPWGVIRFTPEAWMLGGGFSVFYTTGAVLLLLALRLGPVSLTNIIALSRLFVPILVGLVLWNDTISWNAVLGILIFLVAIIFINCRSEEVKTARATFRWALLSMAAGLSTGIALCFTKEYGFRYPNSCKEYLLAYNAIIIIFATPYLLIKRKKIIALPATMLKFLGTTALAALALDIMSLIFMFYINQFNTAVYLPMMAILALIAATLVGRIFYKERITLRGYFGIVLGIAAILLLNL